MSATWNGSYLTTRFLQKYGFTDSSSQARILEWINDLQRDICASHAWPFLKFKMKKQVTSGDQEIDVAPQIPLKQTVAASAGGSLASTIYYVKSTFVLFDETGKIENSLESEPSEASDAVTAGGVNKTLSISWTDVYNGSSIVRPLVFWRRIYISTDGVTYYLAKEIKDNVTLSTTIDADTTSTIEPPEFKMIFCLSGEDPVIENSGIALYQNKLDDLIKFDPTFKSKGLTQYYARSSDTKILLYPKPASTFTISYWVYRIPARIYNTTDKIQFPHFLKEVLDAGVTWKGYEYKDSDGQESKKMNYEARLKDAKGIYGRNGGQSLTVKVVC